jgi:hypothetical protein
MEKWQNLKESSHGEIIQDLGKDPLEILIIQRE